MKTHNFESLMQYMHNFENTPDNIEQFKNNFELYLDLCNKDNIIDFLNTIKVIPQLSYILYKNYDLLYKKFEKELILEMTQERSVTSRFQTIYDVIKNYSLSEFIEDLYNRGEVTYICNNMKDFITSFNIAYLTRNGILIKLKQIAPEKFKEFHPIIISQLSKPTLIFSDPVLLNALTIIAEEIAENEKTDISEIEYIERGGYSTVSKLGNKVIKYGYKRFTYEIPYHRRILQPLIRRKILPEKLNPYHDEDFFIEIAEYIKPDKRITDEDVYLVYKELREDGVIWVDAKKENLGRLEKENIIHYNEPLYVDDESLGFIPETIKKSQPLQKGDLVIIDTDYLFRENDPNINRVHFTPESLIYERRYQKEKKERSSYGRY